MIRRNLLLDKEKIKTSRSNNEDKYTESNKIPLNVMFSSYISNCSNTSNSTEKNIFKIILGRNTENTNFIAKNTEFLDKQTDTSKHDGLLEITSFCNINSPNKTAEITINPKNYYFKRYFKNPNPYYKTCSIVKAKLKNDFSNSNSSNNLKERVKSLNSSQKLQKKITIKELDKHNKDGVFLTLNNDFEINQRIKKISINKILSQDNSSNISKNEEKTKKRGIKRLKTLFVEAKKVRKNTKEYNNVVRETNKKKYFVFYKDSPNKIIKLPNLIFPNFQNQLLSKTNSKYISLNKCKGFQSFREKICCLSPIIFKNNVSE